MRYTEARLKRIADELLSDIYKETVDFQPNFDDSLQEPSVMPAKLPNLLLNGSSGIAVGMATNMAPHNLTEIVDGIMAYLDNADITIEELMEYVKAPDFSNGSNHLRDGGRQVGVQNRPGARRDPGQLPPSRRTEAKPRLSSPTYRTWSTRL